MMKKIYSILVCMCILAGFVACEKDKDFALTTLTVTNETVTPSYETAEVSCGFKADATISEAYVQYSLSSGFADYEVAKMTEEKGKYVALLTDLVDNTTYYIRYAASNKFSSVVTEEVVEFQTLQCAVPTIVLDSIGGVRESQAKAYLHLTFDGGASVTDMGICWSEQANPTIENMHKSTKDTAAVLDIADLQENTKYYVRAYAVNKVGVSYSEELVFTTYALPEVRTEEVTDIQVNTALLSATLIFDGNDMAIIKGFCWSDKAEPTINENHIAVDTNSANYTYLLSDLLPATEYHVRAYAQNKIGVVYGEEKTFTTVKEVLSPTVTTASVTQITETGAVVGGNVTGNGGASVTERGVVYSLSANPAITDLSSTIVRSGSGTGAFTCNLSNLQAGTTYYVRAYAINSKGTAYGDEISFTTALPITLATVTTASIAQITETTAVAGGTVTSDGNASVTERGVCVATASNPTTSNTKITSGSGTGSFTCDLTNLQPNTTYYLRAYATNEKGTAYGEEVSFTTNKNIVLPSLITNIVTQITETTAVAGGNVTSDGNASVTERGIVYSTNPNPVITNLYNTIKPCGSGTGAFTCDLTNLQPNTTYYVRAYATNSMGTAYGEEVSFTTNTQIVLPSLITNIITQITETTAVAGGNVTSDGNASVTERGVVYSTNPNPVITNLYNTIKPCGSGTGSFTCDLTNLQPNTTYYVRAYATNSMGTAYGEEVSFTTKEESNTPSNGTENGYEYVDLGLSVKWATMNVGASKPEEYGDYFAWGEVEPKEVYDWSTYKWCNGSLNTLTKYNTSSSYGTVDNKTTLELSDDAARVNWGGAWRMPTDAEWTELRTECTWTIIEQNGVNGCKVTSKYNNNSIFFPSAGVYQGNSLVAANSSRNYWSSSLSIDIPIGAWTLDSYSNYIRITATDRRFGRSVRPVLGENEVEVTTPTVTTTTVTQITETTAVAGGNVTSDGGASVTERGVVYSTNPNPVITNLYNTIKPCGSGTGSFTCDLTNLQSNTTYYVRAYATNSMGTAYGEEVSFTTSKSVVLPTVTTSTVTQIMQITAVAGGTVTSDGNASVTERGVVYSLSANPAITDLSSTIVRSGSGTGTFTCNLSNLQAGTTYYVRAYAINSKGTAYGDEISFTTALPITLATVTTASIAQITETTAVAGGTVTSDGNASVTERGVCISTVSNPTTSNTKITAGSGTGSFTCNLTGLQANTTYYVRAYAINSKGTAYGDEISFTTALPITLATVTTASITQITETTAVAGGNVTSDGNASVTERGVCVATASNPTTSNTKITSGSGTGSFTCNLTGLQPNTTYYVRAYAINSKGTAYGDEISFTTALPITLATVTTASITQITETSAVADGNVTSDGNASVTERGVVYSTNPNPVITNLYNTIKPCGSGTGSFTCDLTNLQPNTTYYVRAYATNEMGTAYGEEISFTTLSLNGHEYVDLGLSVKWATCNVGASSPEKYGDFFAWGETEPKEQYYWSTYKHYNDSSSTLTKYNIFGTVADNKTQLELSDDAARANWGGSWRMPTYAELTELREQCTWTWTRQNGVYGYKVTSKSNGNSIFLPAAGSRDGSSLGYPGDFGNYWLSSLYTLYTDNSNKAFYLGFTSGFVGCGSNSRYLGLSVRPVCP